jgi:hypothetical protein
MKASSETVIDLPSGRIDLPAWLATLSDRDRGRAPLMRSTGREI